jgi:Protein of unknown function (DUF1308)
MLLSNQINLKFLNLTNLFIYNDLFIMEVNKVYLFDITTLITFVSDICNCPTIGKRFGDIKNWKTKNVNIYNHLVDEEKDPVLPKLKNIINDGKWLTTKIAWEKVTDTIFQFGSDQEKEKLNQLHQLMTIIEDDPSPQFMNITNKYWGDTNKNIFGTAHKNQYIIVTGNINAIKFILNNEIDIEYIAHRSRCFVGKKFEIKI